MNSKERCLAVLNRQTPDRTPFFPLMMFFAADRAGLDFRTFATDPAALADAQQNLFENYGLDAVTVASDAFRISADLGAEMAYPKDQTPHSVRPLLASEQDFRRLERPDPQKPGSRMRQRIDAIEMLHRAIGDRCLVCGWVEMPFAEICDWFGVEDVMYLLYDEPELVHQALSFAAELEIEYARHQIAAGAELIGCGDAAASLLSAPMFEEFALPYEQRVTAGIRAAGGRSKLHICGNTMQSLPLIAQNGADLVNIDSLVDFDYAVRLFGEAGMAFKGNADPVRDLMGADPEHALAKGRELVSKAAGLPFMLSPGCEIPAATPDAVLRAFASAAIG